MAAIQEAARSVVTLLVNGIGLVSTGYIEKRTITDVEVFATFLYLGGACLYSQRLFSSLVEVPWTQELCCNTDPLCQGPDDGRHGRLGDGSS